MWADARADGGIRTHKPLHLAAQVALVMQRRRYTFPAVTAQACGSLMPRSAAAKGRAGYPAMMDERWRESVQGPVGQQFLARVTVRDADTRGEYDEDTHGHTNTPGAVVWQGMGRLVALPAMGSTPQNAGQTVTLRGYRLTIPHPGAMFKPGQRVSFDSDDPVLDSLVLTVSANQAASIRLQTSVVLEADEG